MEEGRKRRKCPRIPVYLDVRVDQKDGIVVKGKVINISTEGICIKTDDPVFANEEITVEFSLTDTLTSVRLNGRVVWYRYDTKTVESKDQLHFLVSNSWTW
jgi:Tfp pilus assembly protein PilZ